MEKGKSILDLQNIWDWLLTDIYNSYSHKMESSHQEVQKIHQRCQKFRVHVSWPKGKVKLCLGRLDVKIKDVKQCAVKILFLKYR